MRIVGQSKATSSRRIRAAVVTLLSLVSSATLFAWADNKKGGPAPQGHAAAPAGHAAAPGHASQSARPTTAGPRTAPAAAHPTTAGARTAPGGAHPTSAGARTAPGGAHPTTAGARTAPGGAHPMASNARPGVGGRPAGGRDVRTAGGGSAHFDSRGHVQEVHAHGMDIRRGPGGVHRIERVGPGGRVVVTNGAGHGYVQRPFRYGGRAYYQRTYYVNGVPYGRAYRSYFFGGVAYGFYAPARFWAPGFYGWAFSPWAVPVVYSFGWRGNPWFGFYGGYYNPYPAYSTPAMWLTDYYMGATLQAAYQERMAELNAQNQAPPPPPDNQVALSPGVKQMIADEVQRQLQQERNEAAQATSNAAPVDAPPPVFADNTPRIFVVKTGLDLTSQGQQCPVTEGDVLQTRGALPTNSPSTDAFVLASKGQDCAKGSMVTVAVQDLVEMQNNMRETLDQGLGELQSKQGKGLPAMPASYLAQPRQANFVSSAPPPEQNIADELSRQAREANQAEQEVVSQALGTVSSAAAPAPAPVQQQAPVSISLGQSTADVVAAIGQPQKSYAAGPKTIYVYKDLKITFLNGRVADVQ